MNNRAPVGSKNINRVWLSLFAMLAGLGFAAEGLQADYDRAAGLQRLTSGKVFRDTVKPYWFENGTQLWYKVRTGPNSYEFVFVDAEKAERRPFFDHAKMAAALTTAGIKNTRADDLLIEPVGADFQKQTLDFRSGEKYWRCDLATYKLARIDRKDANNNTVSDSKSRGDQPNGETEITFVNRTSGVIEIFWTPGDGERRSYGKIAVGETHRQHTFAGHKWSVVDAQGKELTKTEGLANPRTVEVKPQSSTPGQPPAKKDDDKPRTGRGAASPDGKWRAFVRDQNVFLRDAKSNEEFQLSADGTAEKFYDGTFYWSPDSKKLAAIRTTKPQEHKIYLVESAPKDQPQPRLHEIDYLKPGDSIAHPAPCLFDVATRKQVPVSDALFPNPWSITAVRWHPNSGSFSFLYNQRGHQVLRMVEIDAETGAARALVDEQSKTFIEYAAKYYCEWLPQTKELIWMSERDGWNHLYLYDTEKGVLKNQITRGEWVVRGIEAYDTKNRTILFRAGGVRRGQDPYFIHYCRINFDGTGLTILTEADGTHSIDYKFNRPYFIDTWSRVDQPPVSELRRFSDGKFICELERADMSALLKTGWQPPERFVAKGRDGVTDIYGIIIRPINFDSKKSYPVIEDIYAGPQSSFVPKNFSSFYRSQTIAELGFIIVKMDGMGTSNRSKKFHDICWRNLGDGGFPDRILWIKAAAAKYSYMDVSRVGIYGGSAGGQNAARAVIDHGDFYKAAHADCGCHDNRMDKIWWNELYMGWPVGPEYDTASNITQARRLTGKLMLNVGELDKNVDPATTLQFAAALVKANKDFELLVIPGAGHGCAETPYGSRRRQDFFVRTLLKTEPPPFKPQ